MPRSMPAKEREEKSGLPDFALAAHARPVAPDPIRGDLHVREDRRVPGGGRRRSRTPVFFPECSISWQEIMKKYRRRACNSAKYDRMKTEQKTGSGFRRPRGRSLPHRGRRGKPPMGRAGEVRPALGLARGRNQAREPRRRQRARPPARDCARHSGAPAPRSRAAGKRSEDGSRGEPDAEIGKPGRLDGIPARNDGSMPGTAAGNGRSHARP